MKKILFGLIGVMAVTGVIALIYAITRPHTPEAELIADDDTWYPSEMRPGDEDILDSNVSYDPDILLDLEELTPDEDFTEFEIEEKEEEEEAAPEEEPEEPGEPEEEAPPEPAPEAAPPTKETLPQGSPIIINRKVNMRIGPDNGYEILGVAEAGDIGEMVQAGERWSLINCREWQGYVFNDCWDIYTPQ